MKEYKKIKDNVYTAEENFVTKCDQFFVAVSVDKEGREGVVAEIDFNCIPPIEKPLMGASIADRDAILETAKKACKQAGVKVRVVRFTSSETIAEFVPDHLN